MTQAEIEAKLTAIQTYLTGQADIVTFHESRIKEIEVFMSTFKAVSGGGQSTATLTGVESQTITFNFADVYEVLFFNDIAYTARLQIKGATIETVKYLQVFKDGKLISNISSNFPVQLIISPAAIQFLVSGRITYSIPLQAHTGNATFLKVQKK
jgi:ribosomal protein L10